MSNNDIPGLIARLQDEADQARNDGADDIAALIDEAVAALSAPAAQAEPVAWTLKETLDARETTTNAHLWFSNPVNSGWVPLYAAPVAAQPVATPPASWDEYAMREAQRLWSAPAMPKSQLVNFLHCALIDAMRFAVAAQPVATPLSVDLHKFLNAAAGEGLVLDGVDAADLYIATFPERYAATVAHIDACITAPAEEQQG